MKRICPAICFGLAILWNVGCTAPPKGAAPTASVKGTVELDGKLAPSGELHFSIADYPPSVLQITNGTYSGEAPVGKNKVEVFIYVEGPASEKYGGVRSKTNTAPEKYWGPNTTLDATVKAGEANEFKFKLTSKN